MSTLTVTKDWRVDGSLTDADALPTLGIVDNTTQTTVVTPGTHMTGNGGQYQYLYASAVAGHTYTSTIAVVYLGATYTSQVVSYVPASTTVPASNDNGSTAYIAVQWAAQRGLWTNIKNAALGALAAMIAGPNVGYSISGPDGSESLSFEAFEATMLNTAERATKMEIELTQAMQDARPFDIRQRVGVRGRW